MLWPLASSSRVSSCWPALQPRQPPLGVVAALVVAGGRVLVAGLDVGLEEAGEGDRAAAGGELDGLVGGAAAGQPDADGLAHRVGHLRGDGALPDQLVEPELVAGQLRGELARRPEVVTGGTDRLVRLLGALGLALVAAGLRRDERVAVELARLLAGGVDRLLRQVRRVGTHVGDVAVLVQPLGHPHRLRRRPAQLAPGVHLQRRRGERGVRATPVGLLVDAADGDLAALETGGQPAGTGLVEVHDVAGDPAGGGVEVAAGGHPAVVDADQLGPDRRRLPRVGGCPGRRDGEGALEGPVVGGVEGHALPLALHDDARGHRLHAPGRELRQDLLPEDRADLVAVEPVEDAAGLLGVDQRRVELARVGHGPGDRLGGDLVEDHAVDRDARLERVDQVPGDRLALAVLICGEVDLARTLHQLLEPGDLLLAVGADHVERLEGVVDVDTQPRPGGALVLGRNIGRVAGQVADVADAGLDDVVGTQVSGDLVRLRRRLHDDQRLATGRGRPPPGRRLRAAGGRVGALASGLAGLRGHGAPVGGAAVVPGRAELSWAGLSRAETSAPPNRP